MTSLPCYFYDLDFFSNFLIRETQDYIHLQKANFAKETQEIKVIRIAAGNIPCSIVFVLPPWRLKHLLNTPLPQIASFQTQSHAFYAKQQDVDNHKSLILPPNTCSKFSYRKATPWSKNSRSSKWYQILQCSLQMDCCFTFSWLLCLWH